MIVIFYSNIHLIIFYLILLIFTEDCKFKVFSGKTATSNFINHLETHHKISRPDNADNGNTM